MAPWPFAELEPILREIDADDALRAGQAAAGNGAEADHPRPEHGAGGSGLDLGGVEGGAEPGGQPAGEQAGAVERGVGAHLRQRDLGHHGGLRERRGTHEVAKRIAVELQARGAVGQVAQVLLLAYRQAEVGARVAAVDALTALRGEQRDHVVADRERAHLGADGLDDAGALVAQHGRRVARRVDARRGVEVGVADAAGDQPHQDLALLRLGELDLADVQRRAEFLEHRGADLHRPSSIAIILSTHERPALMAIRGTQGRSSVLGRARIACGR